MNAVLEIILYSIDSIFLADFRDTWSFLDGRVKDAFDLKKTIQEVYHFPFGSLMFWVLSIFRKYMTIW